MMAKPNRIENSRTWRISPCAKAPTTVSGMMCRKKSTVFCASACLAKPATLVASAMAPPKTGARSDGVADDQPDHERKGRDDFEIDQRLDADAANFLRILNVRDTRH